MLSIACATYVRGRSVVVDGAGTHYERTESLCYLQAFTLQYFYLASYLWTACFAFHLYQIIVKRCVYSPSAFIVCTSVPHPLQAHPCVCARHATASNEYPEQFLWVYRSVSWGVPGAALLFLILRQLTGHVGVGPADRRWCWLAVHSKAAPSEWRRDGALQQLLLFYAPIACVFVFNAVVYAHILRFLAGDPLAVRFQRKVVLYLGIGFLCSVWGLVNRLVQFFDAQHEPSRVLTVLESVCDPLQPLLNALAYGTTRQSLDAYKERFCAAWFYASLPSSDDDESGVDASGLLSSADEEPSVGLRVFAHQPQPQAQQPSDFFPYAASPR